MDAGERNRLRVQRDGNDENRGGDARSDPRIR
jgi:hypothetical protein